MQTTGLSRKKSTPRNLWFFLFMHLNIAVVTKQRYKATGDSRISFYNGTQNNSFTLNLDRNVPKAQCMSVGQVMTQSCQFMAIASSTKKHPFGCFSKSIKVGHCDVAGVGVNVAYNVICQTQSAVNTSCVGFNVD